MENGKPIKDFFSSNIYYKLLGALAFFTLVVVVPQLWMLNTDITKLEGKAIGLAESISALRQFDTHYIDLLNQRFKDANTLVDSKILTFSKQIDIIEKWIRSEDQINDEQIQSLERRVAEIRKRLNRLEDECLYRKPNTKES